MLQAVLSERFGMTPETNVVGAGAIYSFKRDGEAQDARLILNSSASPSRASTDR